MLDNTFKNFWKDLESTRDLKFVKEKYTKHIQENPNDVIEIIDGAKKKYETIYTKQWEIFNI